MKLIGLFFALVVKEIAMFRIRSVVAGLRALFRKKQVEREMDEELRDYLDAAAKDKMRSGMSREEATRAARVEMGSMDAVKEEIRSAGWESTLETIWQDLRFGLRVLRRNPGFTAVAALTLALGIGGTAVVFSLLDAVLLRPLPYPQSERLFRLFPLEGKRKRGVEQASYADFRDWQRQTRTFESLAAYGGDSLNLTGTAEPERVRGFDRHTRFLRDLGSQPRNGTRVQERRHRKRGHLELRVLEAAIRQRCRNHRQTDPPRGACVHGRRRVAARGSLSITPLGDPGVRHLRTCRSNPGP